MRYQNWDVLVFPEQSKIPLQEFKTSCQVIQDPESLNSQTNPLLLPTVTSFIPGLQAGVAFRVSLHCWQNPEISRYVHNLKRLNDTIVFEVRLFVDGRLVGSKWFPQHGPWPTVIELSNDLNKNGEFEKLKFPAFHKELLQQNYWNPGDDLGRIKVIIAEGFARENPTYPFERVKNIVCFSFQHAPLEVLEASSIAWPNAAMWRQVSLVGPYFAQQFSPGNQQEVIDLHSHSPRNAPTCSGRQPLFMPALGSMAPPDANALPRQPQYDPFVEPHHATFSHWRKHSTDLSMQDYPESQTRASSSRQVSDHMPIDRPQENMTMSGAYDTLCDALMPSAPTNTPQGGDELPEFDAFTSQHSLHIKLFQERMSGAQRDAGNHTEMQKIPTQKLSLATKKEHETANASSITNTPQSLTSVDLIRSKKKTLQDSPTGENTTVNEPMRKVSHFSSSSYGGNKRQRIVTPASSKVIDDEDEPRSSPGLRGTSRISSLQSTMHDASDKENIAPGNVTNT